MGHFNYWRMKMGLLGKLLKKSPIGKKLIKHDPVGKKLMGGGGKKTGGMGQKTASALGTMGKMKTGGPGQVKSVARPPMKTGGPSQVTKTRNAQRMSDFARPRGKRPAY